MVKKILLSLLGVLFAGVIAAGIVVWLSWSRIPSIISSKLSQKMGVTVVIGDMRFSWDEIDVHNISIANPRGYILSTAFTAKVISVLAPVRNYLDNPIVIDRVEINGVYVGIELDSKKSKKGNWTTILGNLEKNKTKGKGKSVLIKKLVLTNIDIDLAFTKEGQVNHLDRIKRLEFNNVTSEEGIPYEQISSIILNQMLKQIFTIDNITDMLQNFIPQGTPGGNAIKALKGLFSSDASD